MSQNSTRTNSVGQFIFLAIIGMALIIILTIFRGTAIRSSSIAQSSTPIITVFTTSSPDKTNTVAVLMTSKAIAILEATELAQTPVPPRTLVILSTGIYDDQPVKVSGSLLFIDAQNAWSGITDGYHVYIFVGALQSDPDQGVVYMTSPRFEQFLTPSKHGAVRVVSEQNDRLTLVALDETIFYFDISTCQFVASLTEVAPSVTPSPVITSELTSVPYPAPTEASTQVP
jgi:WD40 repeat protein